MKPIPCEIISWSRFDDLSRQLAAQIKNEAIVIDMIVGIGRGGYLPARMLSDYLAIFDLSSFKIEHYLGAHKDKQAIVKYALNAPVDEKTILLVDDVSDSGDTFNVAIEHIKSLGAPKKIVTAALHHKVVSSYEPDFYAEKIEQWRWLTYPWAVCEDLSTFIAAIDYKNKTTQQLSGFIFENHGFRPSAQQLQDALWLLNNTNGFKTGED